MQDKSDMMMRNGGGEGGRMRGNIKDIEEDDVIFITTEIFFHSLPIDVSGMDIIPSLDQ